MMKANYSKISSSYDKGRRLSEQNIELWLSLLAKYINPVQTTTLLDLGCGTGRFSLPIANQLRYCVFGADSSSEMLTQAKKKDTKGLVTWIHQDAQHLAFRDSSLDVVFMSHLLHHVDSPPAVLKECNRILSKPGLIVIRYGAIEQIRYDVVHTFIPETLAIDEARTPTINIVDSWLVHAGFSNIINQEVVQQTYETSNEHLESVKLKGTSVLTLISQQAFDRGVNLMSDYIRQNQDDPWLLSDKFTLTVARK